MDKVADKRKHSFFQIDNEIVDDERVKAYDMAVYFCLARYANRETDEAFPAISTLERLTGMSRNTVRASLKRLEELRYISIEPRHLEGKNAFQSNLYTLLDAKTAYSEGRSGDDLRQQVTEEVGQEMTYVGHQVIPNNTHTNNTQLEQDKNTVLRTGASATPRQVGLGLVTLKPVPAVSKPAKETKPERSARRIRLAKASGDWSEVNHEDFTYYYIAKHNELLKKQISLRNNKDVAIFRDSFIVRFSLLPDQVCDHIDELIRQYSTHPKCQGFDQLSFGTFSNFSALIDELMISVRHKLKTPVSKPQTPRRSGNREVF